MASMQLLSLGSMPPPIKPSPISFFASETVSSEIRVFLSEGSLYTPSISVRNASFSAETALAIAHAASSALILYVLYSSSRPIGHTIGRKSFSSRS